MARDPAESLLGNAYPAGYAYVACSAGNHGQKLKSIDNNALRGSP